MAITFSLDHGTLVLDLPLTTPTGVIRVKRPMNGLLAEPVATRSQAMEAGDYLEWQINYDTDNPEDPTRLAKVEVKKPDGRVVWGSELVWMIHHGREHKLITATEWKEVLSILNKPLTAGLTDLDAVARLTEAWSPAEPTDKSPLIEGGWQRHVVKVPDYQKNGDGYAVQLRIEKKQRAVGNQAMIYLQVPLNECESTQNHGPLPGRSAEKLETARYVIRPKNRHLLLDSIMAFAFASQDHRNDLRLLLTQLK